MIPRLAATPLLIEGNGNCPTWPKGKDRRCLQGEIMTGLLGLIGFVAAIAMVGGIAGVASATTIFQEIELAVIAGFGALIMAVSWGFMAVLWALDEIRKRLPEPADGRAAYDGLWVFLKWVGALLMIIMVGWAITIAERQAGQPQLGTAPEIHGEQQLGPPAVDQPK